MAGDTEANTPGGRPGTPARRAGFGLQFRFTLLVLGLTLSVAALVGVLLVDLAGQMTSRHKREQCLQFASLLARCAAEPLARGDAAALQSLAEEFSSGDPILFVTFTDPAGMVIAGADASGAGADRPGGPPPLEVGESPLPRSRPGLSPRSGEPGPPHGVAAEGRAVPLSGQVVGTPLFVPQRAGVAAHLEETYPIISPRPDQAGERPLAGYVRVGLNVERTISELAAAIDLFSGAGIALLTLSIPLAYLVVRCIVVPLNELSRTVRRFAEGDLTARSTVRRTDEVGQLAQAFNAMADDLGRNHRQILGLNADLERRVHRRTRQLRELASREPLTGLYNRRHFNEVLARRFSEAARYQADLSCLMIDLDDFKGVNDRFGHQVGDELLILASVTIASQLRAADVAARLGGDEFIILLPQTSADRAQVLGERVAEKFALDVADQFPLARVGMSIGIASQAEGSPSCPEDLVRAADRAMYRAKTEGKRRIVLASPAPA